MRDAILDRAIHRAHRIKLKGESLRKRNAITITITENPTNSKEKRNQFNRQWQRPGAK